MTGKKFRAEGEPGRKKEETTLDPLDAYFDSLPDDVLPENEQRELAREMIASRISLYATTYCTLEAICGSDAKERKHLFSAIKRGMQELLDEVYQSGTRMKQTRERYQQAQQLYDFFRDAPAKHGLSTQHEQRAEFASAALKKIYAPEEAVSFLRQYVLQRRKSASPDEASFLDGSFQEFEKADNHFIPLRNRLAETQLRLVVWAAKKYRGRGLDLIELISEGNTGLLKALETYDPNDPSGTKLSTYATFGIRFALWRALQHQKDVIHLSEHRQYDQRCLERTIRSLGQHLGRSPEMEEIAAAMDISLQQLQNIYELPKQPLSLDVPCAWEDGPGEPFEQVVSARALDGSAPKSVEDTIVETLDRQKIRVLLDRLVDQKKVNPRDKQIFSRYNGLQGQKEETLESLGIEFELTREGIRQINLKVFRRLQERVQKNAPEDEDG
ncbi:MAG: sigma-70 family RNA polymerase sigma factor [Nanoarchaeota archaeon]|nr:sigma-70 family RNA polymerase sigma factor [Nanoarchaeota archaeon]